MSKRFIHPVHARGVQCSKIDGNVGGPLTDRKITKYILSGHYGLERQQKELAKQRVQPERRNHSRSARAIVQKSLLQLLDGI